MAEHLNEDLVISHEETEITMISCDYVDNTHSSIEIAKETQEKKGIENMFSIASEGVIIEECVGGSEPQEEETEEEGEILPFEQPTQDDVTGVPNDEPDPSMGDPSQESFLQVNNDPGPSPHFDAEPLNMVVPETNLDKPPPKRTTTRLQRKEALEFSLNKSKRSRRRRRHTSKGAESSSKSVIAGSSEKLVNYSGDKTMKKRGKTVKECGDKSDEEEVEKSGEYRQNKSAEKEKSGGKSVKRKRDDDDEEPSSIKKGKVSGTLRSEKRKLGNRKVL
ncbi:uncharacterized protein [Nicotiana sylvestris]|uniref:uncharacterized protein n=1 Tax=Nicotiana sylvestris TaxID=4096 RepID=UPI00388C4A18